METSTLFFTISGLLIVAVFLLYFLKNKTKTPEKKMFRVREKNERRE